jgi:hypothetical protein
MNETGRVDDGAARAGRLIHQAAPVHPQPDVLQVDHTPSTHSYRSATRRATAPMDPADRPPTRNDLVLAALQPMLARVYELAGIGLVIPVRDTIDAAIGT